MQAIANASETREIAVAQEFGASKSLHEVVNRIQVFDEIAGIPSVLLSFFMTSALAFSRKGV
jgi:hypothetical protein